MALATRTILSPNYTRGGWLYGPPRFVVIHSTRSGIAGRSHELELGSTINWFLSADSQASAHWVLSPTERVRMVPDEYPAWHAEEHSFQAYGIELTQPTRDTPYEEGHYRNLVAVCIPYVRAGIPVVHALRLEWGQPGGGFIGHEETAQGLRDGKSDPGPPFNWGKFMWMLQQATQEEDDMTTPEQFAALWNQAMRAGLIKVGRATLFDAVRALQLHARHMDPAELEDQLAQMAAELDAQGLSEAEIADIVDRTKRAIAEDILD